MEVYLDQEHLGVYNSKGKELRPSGCTFFIEYDTKK